MVTFHAHPDDECIIAGGIMRKAATDGHRVVLVVATRGEHGEVDPGFLDDGEELWQRRLSKPIPLRPFSAQPGPSSSATSIPG